MNKQQRQYRIKEIVAQQTILSQEELQSALAKSGVEVTQATLSRDLKEMGMSRVSAPEGMRYVLPVASEERKLQNLLGFEITEIASNESLIIVRTLPGRAQGVAELIDGLKSPLVLATLAGDNTIFIAPKSTKNIAQIEKLIKDFITQHR